MKEEIEYFKQKNGNANVSNKDLMYYIAGKLDKIDSKLNKATIQISKNSTAIYYLKWIVGSIAGALIIFLPRIL